MSTLSPIETPDSDSRLCTDSSSQVITQFDIMIPHKFRTESGKHKQRWERREVVPVTLQLMHETTALMKVCEVPVSSSLLSRSNVARRAMATNPRYTIAASENRKRRLFALQFDDCPFQYLDSIGLGKIEERMDEGLLYSFREIKALLRKYIFMDEPLFIPIITHYRFGGLEPAFLRVFDNSRRYRTIHLSHGESSGLFESGGQILSRYSRMP